jgi:hypothetical protein
MYLSPILSNDNTNNNIVRIDTTIRQFDVD